jgi:hypothetical protein
MEIRRWPAHQRIRDGNPSTRVYDTIAYNGSTLGQLPSKSANDFRRPESNVRM